VQGHAGRDELQDGQFPQVLHAQTARRADLSQDADYQKLS
jgi:hypothetical protein